MSKYDWKGEGTHFVKVNDEPTFATGFIILMVVIALAFLVIPFAFLHRTKEEKACHSRGGYYLQSRDFTACIDPKIMR